MKKTSFPRISVLIILLFSFIVNLSTPIMAMKRKRELFPSNNGLPQKKHFKPNEQPPQLLQLPDDCIALIIFFAFGPDENYMQDEGSDDLIPVSQIRKNLTLTCKKMALIIKKYPLLRYLPKLEEIFSHQPIPLSTVKSIFNINEPKKLNVLLSQLNQQCKIKLLFNIFYAIEKTLPHNDSSKKHISLLNEKIKQFIANFSQTEKDFNETLDHFFLSAIMTAHVETIDTMLKKPKFKQFLPKTIIDRLFKHINPDDDTNDYDSNYIRRIANTKPVYKELITKMRGEQKRNPQLTHKILSICIITKDTKTINSIISSFKEKEKLDVAAVRTLIRIAEHENNSWPINLMTKKFTTKYFTLINRILILASEQGNLELIKTYPQGKRLKEELEKNLAYDIFNVAIEDLQQEIAKYILNTYPKTFNSSDLNETLYSLEKRLQQLNPSKDGPALIKKIEDLQMFILNYSKEKYPELITISRALGEKAKRLYPNPQFILFPFPGHNMPPSPLVMMSPIAVFKPKP